MTAHRRGRRTFAVVVGTGWQAARRQMVITFVTMMLAAAASVTYPLGLREMTDGLISHDAGAQVLGVALTVVLFTASWALGIVGSVHSAGLTDRCNLAITARLANLVNRAPGLEHFERPDHLQELDLLDQNRRLIASGPRQTLSLLQVVVRTLGIVVLLALVYPPLGLLPLAGLGPFLGDRQSVRLRERSDEGLVDERRLAAELFTLSATAVPAKELRVFGLQGELLDRYQRLTNHARRATTRVALRGGMWSALGWLIYAAAFTGTVAVISLRAARGEASLGDVVLAVSLLRRAQMSVSQVSDSIGELLSTSRAARRMVWLEDYVATSTEPPVDPVAVPDRLRQGITFDNVRFAYPGCQKLVLDGIDLHLPAGASVAIVGENGSGKTTLAKLLTGMYRPTQGSIAVDGVDLTRFPLDEWRARLSAAFQDFVTYDLLAGECVGIGDLSRIDDEGAVQVALERAQSTGVIEALPQGFDTPIGRSFTGGLNLSGGQSQKLALARGMMRDEPLLLILDEPTASLDALTESRLFDNYIAAAGRAAGRTGAVTLFASHRFSTVRGADLIVVMEHGRILEVGNHEELIAGGRLYSELFALQARLLVPTSPKDGRAEEGGGRRAHSLGT